MVVGENTNNGEQQRREKHQQRRERGNMKHIES
jgi:hypothetical protein